MKSFGHLLLASTQSTIMRHIAESFSRDGKQVIWLLTDSTNFNMADWAPFVNEDFKIKRFVGKDSFASCLQTSSVEHEIDVAVFCSNMNHCLSNPLADPRQIMTSISQVLRETMEFCRWACRQAKYETKLRKVVLITGSCDCCVCAMLDSSTRMLLKSSSQELAENQVSMNAVKIPRDLLVYCAVACRSDISDQVTGIVEFLSTSQSDYVSGNILSVASEGP